MAIGKKTTVTEIDYSDFETLVQQVFGVKDYSFVAMEECGNDSDHKFSADKKEALDKYNQLKFDEWLRTGNGLYLNYSIIQELVNRGELEPGNYLIRVCW